MNTYNLQCEKDVLTYSSIRYRITSVGDMQDTMAKIKSISESVDSLKVYYTQSNNIEEDKPLPGVGIVEILAGYKALNTNFDEERQAQNDLKTKINRTIKFLQEYSITGFDIEFL